MATKSVKPTFSPSQDMTDVSPEDVKQAKTRTRQGAAYDAASKTPASPRSTPKAQKYACGGMVHKK